MSTGWAGRRARGAARALGAQGRGRWGGRQAGAGAGAGVGAGAHGRGRQAGAGRAAMGGRGVLQGQQAVHSVHSACFDPVSTQYCS